MMTFEFSSAQAAADFYDAVPANASLNHRVVDVQAEPAEVETVRELARTYGGKETETE